MINFKGALDNSGIC